MLKKLLSFSKKTVPLILPLFFILFLAGNIWSSQAVSPLYSGVVNENRDDAVSFLQDIESLPGFGGELRKYIEIFGTGFERQVFAEKERINAEINLFEQYYMKNPQSRDVLYRLYTLYSEKNNRSEAQKYLKLAREIDPGME